MSTHHNPLNEKMLKSYQNAIKRVLNLKNIVVLLCFLFSGCSIYNDSFKPKILSEKKILSSRKKEILQNDKIAMIIIATYLNNVNSNIYNTREYFLIEVFSDLEIPFIDYMHFDITNDERFLWIREIEKDEFDEVINVSNKWSKLYLVAFSNIHEYEKKNLKLNLTIDTFGKVEFDFTYKVFETQF